MLPTVMTLRRYVISAGDPMTPNFWFVMSMGLLVGFVISYPINWWLVANHLKHGMMTVRPASAEAGADDRAVQAGMSGISHPGPDLVHMSMSMDAGKAPWPPVPVMALLSFLALAAGVAIALLPRASWAVPVASVLGAHHAKNTRGSTYAVRIACRPGGRTRFSHACELPAC